MTAPLNPGDCYVVCLEDWWPPGRRDSRLGCLLGKYLCIEHEEEIVAPGYCPQGRAAQRYEAAIERQADRLREMCDL